MARSAAPVALPIRVQAAQVGSFCTCTGSPSVGALHGSGYSNTGGGGVLDHTPISASDPNNLYGELCSSDMDVTLTLSGLTIHGAATYPVARVDIGARVAGPVAPFSAQGYTFSLHSHGFGPSHDYELWNDFGAGSAAYTGTAAGPAANGDVFQLQVHGTSIVAKHNGSTIFSVTDSNIGTFVGGQPTSYASYQVQASGTSDIGSSSFSATPDC